jgi:hypothetical protein
VPRYREQQVPPLRATRSGRDDTFVAYPLGLLSGKVNCRSLGYARDDTFVPLVDTLLTQTNGAS